MGTTSTTLSIYYTTFHLQIFYYFVFVYKVKVILCLCKSDHVCILYVGICLRSSWMACFHSDKRYLQMLLSYYSTNEWQCAGCVLTSLDTRPVGYCIKQANLGPTENDSINKVFHQKVLEQWTELKLNTHLFYLKCL